MKLLIDDLLCTDNTADIKRTYIEYPSGTTVKAEKRWFSSSKVVLGSKIVVPNKPYETPKEADKIDYAKMAAVIQGSLAIVLTAVIIMEKVDK